MKKTLYLIFTFCAVFLSAIVFLNYSDGIYNAVFEHKVCVVIEKQENQPNEHFLSDLASIANDAGAHIMYTTIEEASSKRPIFNVYTTTISSEFIDINSNYRSSEIAGGQYLTTEKNDPQTDYHIVGSTLYTHFRIHSWADAKKLELEHSKFYTQADSLEKLAIALTSSGYHVAIVADENRLEISEAMTELHVMFILLTLFMFFSIICYAFSVRREIIIKKANGYDEVSVFASTFLPCLLYMPMILFGVYGTSALIVEAAYAKTFVSYVCYGLPMVTIYLGVCALLYVIACAYVQFMKSANEIRGNKPSRLLYCIAVCLRVIVSMVIIWGLTCSIQAIRYEKDLECTKENMGHVGEQYVVLSLNAGSVDFYGNNEEYTQKSKELIELLTEQAGAVIVDSSEYMDVSEGYERILYVNEEYFSLQPIYNADGTIIDVNSAKNGTITVLLPGNYGGQIVQFMQEEKISAEILYYAPGQQLHTFNQFSAIEDHGFIRDPIIMLLNDNDLYWRAQSIIGQQFMLIPCNSTNPYEELKSTIEQCGMSSVVLEAQKLTDIFDVAIMNANIKVFQYVIVSILYIMVLLMITVFETTVYYENNKRMLTIKKLHGYGKLAYSEILIVKIGVLITLAILSKMLNYNVAVSAFAAIVDIVVFGYYVEKLENNNIVLYLKGDM